MKATLNKKTDTHAQLTIQLDEAALKPIVRDIYDRLRVNVKAAGFRPGKAPDAIVERELGTTAVQNEVLEAATNHSYSHAIREHELPVITQPEVTLTKFVPYTELEYQATVELLPPIKLANYKHLKAKKPEVKVEDDEVNQVIEDLRKRVATRKDADRAAKLGDEVVIDFDGTKDGKPIEGAKSQNYPLLLGSNSFIPGFEEELVGLKAGSDKGFDITFPKDYGSKELAGQKVHFDIKVHRVVEIVLPEISDEFAGGVGPFKTVAEMRAAVEDNVKAEKQREAARDYERVMLAELQQATKMQVPEKLVQAQAERLRHELQDNLEQRGQTIEDYAAMQGTTPEEINKEVEPEAKRRVELALILTEVAKAENIQVSDADVVGEISRLKSQYTDAEMQRELDRPETAEEIYNQLMATRTIAKITEYNEGK